MYTHSNDVNTEARKAYSPTVKAVLWIDLMILETIYISKYLFTCELESFAMSMILSILR